MKKFFVTAFCLLALSASAIPAAAQTRGRRCNPNVQAGRVYSERDYRAYNNQVYDGGRYDVYRDGYDNRSFWEKHRDKITTAGGAGVGALLGGIAGGKKGAIIGAIAGGGGAAAYTYGIRDRNNRRGF